jgi:hypothetical protein
VEQGLDRPLSQIELSVQVIAGKPDATNSVIWVLAGNRAAVLRFEARTVKICQQAFLTAELAELAESKMALRAQRALR